MIQIPDVPKWREVRVGLKAVKQAGSELFFATHKDTMDEIDAKFIAAHQSLCQAANDIFAQSSKLVWDKLSTIIAKKTLGKSLAWQ